MRYPNSRNSDYVNIGTTINPNLKSESLIVLEKFDINLSEYLRLSLAYLVEHQRPPFDVPRRGLLHRSNIPARIAAPARVSEASETGHGQTEEAVV